MTKTRTLTRKDQGAAAPETITVQLPLPVLAAMTDVRRSFHALGIDAGRQVLGAMMAYEPTARCGPKWIPNPDREAHRGGHTRSLVVLGGRQIEVQRPRGHSRDGHECALPSYQWAAARDPLDHHTVEAIAGGGSTRQYPRTLDPLPRSSAR
jgi:hypothetical protein